MKGTSQLPVTCPRVKLPALKVSRSLIKVQHSNIPLNVPILYPSCARKVEVTMDVFYSPTIRQKPKEVQNKRPYPFIRGDYDCLTVEVIKKSGPKTAKRSKGSMYVTELWAGTQLKKIEEHSELPQVAQIIHKAKKEGLWERIAKLERKYQNRHQIDASDPSKLVEEFFNKGLNSPRLSANRRAINKETKLKKLHLNVPNEAADKGKCLVDLNSPTLNVERSDVDSFRKIASRGSPKGSIFTQESENWELATQMTSFDCWTDKKHHVGSSNSLRSIGEKEERSAGNNMREVDVWSDNKALITKAKEIIDKCSNLVDPLSLAKKRDLSPRMKAEFLKNKNSFRGRQFVHMRDLKKLK